MLNSAFVLQLKDALSSASIVVTDQGDDKFKDFLLRWSDINRRVPGAIIVPALEEDIVSVVKLAVDHDIPFVVKSGGHSLWSTIGLEGFILDLSRLKNITVDKSSRRVTLQSGIIVKEASDAAFEHGLCLPLGSANTAGVIPMALGGGLSALANICGLTSDNIISARLVTAEGKLVVVSSSSHPELFWALRGAGQLFGVVTELTLQAHPLSILGTVDKSVWTGNIIFPADRAEEVFAIMKLLIEDTSAPSTGLCIIAAPPPSFQTCILIIPIYFGPTSDAVKFFSPLLALGPIVNDAKSVPYNHVNDSVDPFCVKGGFKRFSGAGATTFKPELWPRIIEYFHELQAKCPDAGATAFAFEWNSYVPAIPPEEKDTSFSHRNIKVWMEILSWYTDAASHGEVYRIEQETLAFFRSQYSGENEVSYQNWTRDEPLERLYGSATLDRLRKLKQEWDPKGVFTRLLL